ncbi:beta-lactamase class A [Sinosporangium album]|uniref:Beta-lactamase class A n=1 Tax=Sinosporangium album TaxID=504805 RepID=A0A1G7X7F8_9ACTN|nr:serine hydrolase [Sinosporangium album]SDG79510.1 beta-lactamase class A [Sinosporangium album]
MSVEQEIRDIFTEADAEGFVHVREVDGDGEVGVLPDAPVVLASVFKIPILLEYARQVAKGTLEATERLTVTAEYRDGGIGTAGCLDDVSLTVRDLAHFMITQSDNAATDVLLRRVGLDNVHATLRGLGLDRTRLIGGCQELMATLLDDLGIASWEEFGDVDEERIRALPVRDPEQTTSSTSRETTSLLAAIWREEAGPAEACAEVRRIMYNQVWPHRLSSAFGDEVRIGAKTGTIMGIRNEAGVLEFPDGARYAAAVFLRPRGLGVRLPKADAAIGEAAKAAIDHLRSGGQP